MSKKPLQMKATARLADGGELTLAPVLYEHVAALLAAGSSGRSIIHALWTDDWGAPPVYVRLAAVDDSGREVSHALSYTD